MESSLIVKRQWVPFGYGAEYNLIGRLPPHRLPRLVDLCLRRICPPEIFSAHTIQDFKGRDQLNLINSEIADHDKPSGDELLFIAGDIYSQAPGADGKFEPENVIPFEVRVNTAFKEFVGNHHIAHTVRILTRGDLTEELPVRYLGLLIPMRIQKFRLGLDLFESKFLSGMFGFAPTVTQTLLIESNEDSFALRISADVLPKRNIIPLSTFDIFAKLQQVLFSAFGFDLTKNYQEALQK